LIAAAAVTQADGHGERKAALEMLEKSRRAASGESR
jgi:hypothetical protein